MTNEEIFEMFEELIEELNNSVSELDSEADIVVIQEAIDLIEAVAWKYEGDE